MTPPNSAGSRLTTRNGARAALNQSANHSFIIDLESVISLGRQPAGEQVSGPISKPGNPSAPSA